MWFLLSAAFVIFYVLKNIVRKFHRPVPAGHYKGKNVVITGASSGIGEEFAYQFAELGASVCLAARRVEKLEKVLKKCNSINPDGSHIVVKTDVSSLEDCKNLISTAASKMKGIDTLVLNAGVSSDDVQLREVDDEFKQYHKIMDINYWGCVYPARYALPHLNETKGEILVVSSLAGKTGSAGRTGYSPGKFALFGFFDSLRMEEPNLTVTVACPGYVITEIHNRRLESKGEKRNLSLFMTAKEAARQMIEAVFNGDRDFIMTTKARFGLCIRQFLPNAILDRVTSNISKSAFSKE